MTSINQLYSRLINAMGVELNSLKTITIIRQQ